MKAIHRIVLAPDLINPVTVTLPAGTIELTARTAQMTLSQ